MEQIPNLIYEYNNEYESVNMYGDFDINGEHNEKSDDVIDAFFYGMNAGTIDDNLFEEYVRDIVEMNECGFTLCVKKWYKSDIDIEKVKEPLETFKLLNMENLYSGDEWQSVIRNPDFILKEFQYQVLDWGPYIVIGGGFTC